MICFPYCLIDSLLFSSPVPNCPLTVPVLSRLQSPWPCHSMNSPSTFCLCGPPGMFFQIRVTCPLTSFSSLLKHRLIESVLGFCIHSDSIPSTHTPLYFSSLALIIYLIDFSDRPLCLFLAYLLLGFMLFVAGTMLYSLLYFQTSRTVPVTVMFDVTNI